MVRVRAGARVCDAFGGPQHDGVRAVGCVDDGDDPAGPGALQHRDEHESGVGCAGVADHAGEVVGERLGPRAEPTRDHANGA